MARRRPSPAQLQPLLVLLAARAVWGAVPPQPARGAAGLAPAAGGGSVGGQAARPGAFPMLAARGRYIVDERSGQRVRLRCASWSGAQEAWHAPNGLWAQPRDVIARQAKAMGLNCIRLVWSLEAVLGKNGTQAVVPPQALAANPDLLGLSPLEVMAAVVRALGDAGLMVVLDNHSSDAIWCCFLTDANGLWHNDRFSEEAWLSGWRLVATRFANASNVVGAGLRNEPRPTLLGGTQLRFPTWGWGGSDTDFAAAYERAAAVVLAAAPRLMVFAQGLMAGRDLRAVRFRPLRIARDRLAYEAHEYPFLWGSFNWTNYDEYKKQLDDAWGFIVQWNLAPVWLGEFGVEHTRAGVSSPWFTSALRYIKDRDLDWSYWSLDGQQGASRKQGEEEGYGLLSMAWDAAASPDLLQALASIS